MQSLSDDIIAYHQVRVLELSYLKTCFNINAQLTRLSLVIYKKKKKKKKKNSHLIPKQMCTTPTLKQLVEHLAFGLSVHTFIRVSHIL